MGLNEICRKLKQYDNFLITAHTSPEGDALGAQLGFYNLVKKLGKRGVILSDDRLPYGYDFLPGVRQIRRFNRASKNIKFDCLVALDCADLKRAGRVSQLVSGSLPVLNIDHHISNRNFGSVNWVDAQASSCSEMIYKLYKRLQLKIDKDTALALYTGIMTDTGSFRYSNTSSATFAAASDLLKFGINTAAVYRCTYENIPAQDVKVLLKLLSLIRFFSRGRIAAFQIDLKSPGVKKASIDLAEQLLSFGRSIKGVEVVVLFKNNPGAASSVRVNFRSQGKVDVNKIAQAFGGGGHKTAAGATLSLGFSAASRKVIAKLCQALNKQK